MPKTIFELAPQDRRIFKSILHWVRFFALMYAALWIVMCAIFFALLWILLRR